MLSLVSYNYGNVRAGASRISGVVAMHDALATIRVGTISLGRAWCVVRFGCRRLVFNPSRMRSREHLMRAGMSISSS